LLGDPEVVIISRGRLGVESSLEQLTARVGGSVRVRSPEPDKLIAALAGAAIETTPSNDHTCSHTGRRANRSAISPSPRRCRSLN
jgi:hypothetical protein